MSNDFFPDIDTIRFEGPDSDNPLAFRWYDADRVVAGRTMAEHLRFAVSYWHSFNSEGIDIFGAGTLDRPWLEPGRDPMAAAKEKMEVAFEFLEKLGAPFYCFHDRDIAPEGSTFAESCRNFDEMVELAAGHQERTGVRLLWGTANLFSNPRFQAGAATNPDPDLFRYAAAQVAHCMNATKRLGGENYVLWGGREGYDTLLNTDMRRELDQLGRFFNMVDRAQACDRLRGDDPHRAEAVRADEAPVRLRRRDRVLVPAEVRPRERGQGQHRGEPRHARRPRLRPRDRHRVHRRDLRIDRRQRRRRPTRLGPRPLPGVGGADDTRHARDPARRWLHHRRAELRCQAAPPVERPQRPVPRPHRRHGHDGARAGRRRLDPRGRRARPSP